MYRSRSDNVPIKPQARPQTAPAKVVGIGQVALAGRPGRLSRITVVQSELAKSQGRVGDGFSDNVAAPALQQRPPSGTASSRS